MFYVWSSFGRAHAGSFVRGNKDGIHSEIFLLCAISGRLRQSCTAVDRLRTKMHSLLAAFCYLVCSLRAAGVGDRQLASGFLPQHPEERTAQGLHEERSVGGLPCLDQIAWSSTFPTALVTDNCLVGVKGSCLLLLAASRATLIHHCNVICRCALVSLIACKIYIVGIDNANYYLYQSAESLAFLFSLLWQEKLW